MPLSWNEIKQRAIKFSKEWKRKLNLNMIRKLHDVLSIPYESLMKEY